ESSPSRDGCDDATQKKFSMSENLPPNVSSPTPTPSTPPPPPKPVITNPANAVMGPDKMDRRSFFSWFGIAWISFAAATGGALSILFRYLFPNVVFEPPTSFKAGLPSDYEVGVVDERWKEKFGVWMVRTMEGIYALSTTCTHLGCTPNWLGNENKF